MSARPTKFLLAGLAAWTMLVAFAGVAAAYFTAEGSGSGTAATATLLPVTTEAGVAPDTVLHPGGSADVVLHVKNPNDFAVTVIGVVPGAGTVTASGGTGTCTTTGVTFTAPDESFLAGLDPVEAGGPMAITLDGAVSMSTASESGCQGASFAIPVTVEVAR